MSLQLSSEETGVEGGKGEVDCIPWVEACGLVTLCSYRSVTRRLSLVLLKEVRSLQEALAREPDRVSGGPWVPESGVSRPLCRWRRLQ